ncbi:hypothetical protein [Actinomadura sp. CNU-125]|nr:hypothetical protein [Actinomadura sp. CNU-125]
MLTTAGLLADGRLRHPSMGAAILDGTPPADRADLHGALAGCCTSRARPC